MEIKLFDSELKLMNLLWEHEPINAKALSLLASEQYEWNKNTTYTVINKLIKKGIIERSEPGFLCKAIAHKEDIAKRETHSLIERMFSGSRKAFFASFIDDKEISEEERNELLEMLKNHKTK